jgi:hypothetical protein
LPEIDLPVGELLNADENDPADATVEGSISPGAAELITFAAVSMRALRSENRLCEDGIEQQ